MQNYEPLEKIVDYTIKQTIQTKNFDLNSFLPNMEKEFTRLGFREPPARGGGTENFNSET